MTETAPVLYLCSYVFAVHATSTKGFWGDAGSRNQGRQRGDHSCPIANVFQAFSESHIPHGTPVVWGTVSKTLKGEEEDLYPERSISIHGLHDQRCGSPSAS